MIAKKLSLPVLGFLTLFLIIGFASAASFSITNINFPTSVNHNDGSFDVTFDLENTGAISNISWATSTVSGANAKFTLPTASSIDANQTLSITAKVSFDPHNTGTISGKVIVKDDSHGGADGEVPFSVNISESRSLSVSSKVIPQGSNSATVTIKNEGNVNLTGIELTSSGDFSVNFSDGQTTGFDLFAGEKKDVLVTITTDLDRLDLGTNLVTITATDDNTLNPTSASGTLSTEGNYCRFEDNNNLEIIIQDLDVRDGFGDNEDWYPFDIIEVEIDVENNGREDIDDIEVEWGLYDKKRDRFIIDDTEKDFNLKDGKDETLNFEFKLDEDTEDLEDGDFIFIAKATGKDDEFNRAKTCVSESIDITIQIDSDFVILDNINVQESVSPGGTLQFSADVWNIGDDDQEDVLVRISVPDLGVSEKITIKDINAFEDEPLSGSLIVPADAEVGKFYTILFEIFDESNDLYESDDDDASRFGDSFKVEGAAVDRPTTSSDIIVAANLESGGKAGEDLVVKATITNLGSDLVGYDIDASGFSSWASLSSISPRTIILDAGDSKDVMFTFSVDDDASGEQFFDIEVSSNGRLAVSQPASVTIEDGPRGLGITGGFLGGGNTGYLWGIGIINIILVIVIIIVAIRISRR